MLTIDHVIVPVANLAQAAARIETRYGLASVEGGRHPAWGTANRIVPLGDAYVEVVAVVDPETAARAAFGRWVAAATLGHPLGWAVRTDAIEEVGRGLGLPVVRGSRVAPGGELLRWRTVGVEVATRRSGLPFFIQWDDGVALPAAIAVRHPRGRAHLKLMEVTEDPERFADWLGDHDLPLSVTAGLSGLSAVVLRQGHRDVELLIA